MNKTTTARPPSYLQPIEYCYYTLAIALFTSLLTISVLIFCVSQWAALFSKADYGTFLKLISEFGFLLCCTAALWKHAIKL